MRIEPGQQAGARRGAARRVVELRESHAPLRPARRDWASRISPPNGPMSDQPMSSTRMTTMLGGDRSVPQPQVRGGKRPPARRPSRLRRPVPSTTTIGHVSSPSRTSSVPDRRGVYRGARAAARLFGVIILVVPHIRRRITKGQQHEPIRPHPDHCHGQRGLGGARARAGSAAHDCGGTPACCWARGWWKGWRACGSATRCGPGWLCARAGRDWPAGARAAGGRDSASDASGAGAGQRRRQEVHRQRHVVRPSRC